MKARLLIIAVAVFGIAVWLTFASSSPPPVNDILERAFQYRLKSAPEVIARKYDRPLAIHGVWYWEDTTLHLTASDYSALIAQLSADSRYEKKPRFDGRGFYYERSAGKQRISWWSDRSGEFSYSYAE